MGLKLKEGCWYECDPNDWQEVAVCGFSSDDGAACVEIVRATVVPGVDFTIGGYTEDGLQIQSPSRRGHGHWTEDLKARETTWAEAAHAALVERGWFTPWEVV